VLEDDGADRGIIFVFAEAHVGRQFEFVKTQRLNDGMLYAVRQLRKPILAAVNGTAHIDVG
jgi:enoyl-CoA hydratase/carnithine racemase